MAAHHPDGSPVPAVRTHLGVAAAPLGGHGARDWVVSVRPLYQRFKFEIVAHWPQDGDWSISAAEVLAWLDAATEAGE
jgi:hypothetical protein